MNCCNKIVNAVSIFAMHRLAFLLLVATGFAHGLTPHVPPDEAARHVLKAPDAKYPELAAQAQIQGNVILEIRVDDSGAVSVTRLVQGHPMLAPAAITGVNQWRYRPFEVNGKPTAVKTFVMVTFGRPFNHDKEDHAELVLQDDFWTSADAAEEAVSAGDFPRAEEKLKHDGDLVSADAGTRHIQERWQWMTTMGQLRMAQRKYEEAERYYKNALSLREKEGDKDSPDVGASLGNLAALFADEKNFDASQDYASRSLAIFQKDFKKTSSANPGAKQVYGRAAATESWLLVKLAKDRGDTSNIEKRCAALAEFQSFLNGRDRQSADAACPVLNSTPEAKP